MKPLTIAIIVLTIATVLHIKRLNPEMIRTSMGLMPSDKYSCVQGHLVRSESGAPVYHNEQVVVCGRLL